MASIAMLTLVVWASLMASASAHVQTFVSKHIPVITMAEAIRAIPASVLASVNSFERTILLPSRSDGMIGTLPGRHHRRRNNPNHREASPARNHDGLLLRLAGNHVTGSEPVIASPAALSGPERMLELDSQLVCAQRALREAFAASPRGSLCAFSLSRALRQLRFSRAFALLNDAARVRRRLRFSLVAIASCLAASPPTDVFSNGTAATDAINSVLKEIGWAASAGNGSSTGQPPLGPPAFSPGPVAPPPRDAPIPSPGSLAPPPPTATPPSGAPFPVPAPGGIAPSPQPSAGGGPGPGPAEGPVASGAPQAEPPSGSSQGGGGGVPGNIIQKLTTDYCSEDATFDGNTVTVLFTETQSCHGTRIRSEETFPRNTQFSVSIKCSSGDTSGINQSFYLSSLEGSHDQDEIDFEFLGDKKNSVQLNYYVSGVGGHELIIMLPFDCSQDFHQYAIDYTDQAIVWKVDGATVRVVQNDGSNPFPQKDVYMYSSVWDASFIAGGTWAGVYNGADAPYHTYYRNFASLP